MAHKAETILAAITSSLTGLTTTGSRVLRSNAYEVQDANLPGLVVNMAADEVVPGSDGNMAFVDRLLNVQVHAYIKTTATLDTTLNQIRAEVWAALMADRQQGALVIDTRPQGDDAPELDALEQGVAKQTLNWQFHYRHSITNPEA